MKTALKALAPADAPCNNSPEIDDSQDYGQLKGRSALGLDDASAEKVLARADTGSRPELTHGKWLFGTHQWQVLYTDESGRQRSCTKGLVASVWASTATQRRRPCAGGSGRGCCSELVSGGTNWQNNS